MKYFEAGVNRRNHRTESIRIVNKKIPDIGRLEQLPKWMNLIPMVLQWTALSLRYRSASLPSSANPRITSGGMVGEGKLEYFDIMGSLAFAATAPFTSVYVKGNDILHRALQAMNESGLDFPVIVKPDIGWCGFGVQRIDNSSELSNYISRFPKNEIIVIQHFVPYEGEAGIFYARHPDEAEGRIIGMLLRFFPKVNGDGFHTVRELMAQDLRLERLGRDGLHVCSHDPDYVPASGETVRLATIGSTRVGGLYRDGSDAVTPHLTRTLDLIARDMDQFHIGRFDVRYKNMEALQSGDFSIIEVNGSGSEAVHAWDPKFKLREAYAIVFSKQRLLFRIADAMRRRGHKPIGLIKLARLHIHQQKLIGRYPPSN